MNDVDVRELLASVAAGPEPAVGLDATRAMDQARRMLRRRWVTAAVSVAAAAVCVSGGLALASNGDRTDRPTPGPVASNPAPDIAAFDVDVSSGSAFAQSILPAVRSDFPGATVSVLSGAAEPNDWGGPVYGASYLVFDNGVGTTVFVDSGAASAAGYSMAHPQTPCTIVGANDECSAVPDGELRTTAPRADLSGQVAAMASGVVVRWVAHGGPAPQDIGGVQTLALARAVAAAMPRATPTPPPGPSGLQLVALQTWVQARALLAPYGASTWGSAEPYSGDPRTPAMVLFQLPSGQSAEIFVLARDSYRQAAPSADQVTRHATSTNGLIYEARLPGDVFTPTQAQQLADLLAGVPAGASTTVPTPTRS